MCMCVCIFKIHLLLCLLLLIDSYIYDFMNAYIEYVCINPSFASSVSVVVVSNCVCKYERMYYACMSK